MWPREDMQAVIAGVRYQVRNSLLLAHNRYWDGSNWDRGGYNTYLYRSPQGRYFAVYMTRWEGQRDSIEPLTTDEAQELYNLLRQKEVPLETAFPQGAICRDA